MKMVGYVLSSSGHTSISSITCQEPNDLAFSSGEIIEIVDETNTDWWTGKCRGRQGLFPSNHVEKIDDAAASPAPPVRAPAYQSPPPTSSYQSPPPQPVVPYQSGPPQPYSPNYVDEKNQYRPYGAPYQPPAPVAQPVMAAPPPQQVIVQEAAPPKKNRFGGLGGTVSSSALTRM